MESQGGQINQKISGRGGYRPGAGRKPMNGAEEITRKMKRKFNEYVTEEEIEQIVACSVADALNGKSDMQKFLLEQWFGKATQRQVQEDGEGNALVPLMVKFIDNGNNNTNRV